MRLRTKRRGPWDRPRFERLRSIGFKAPVALVLALAAGAFVFVVQPFAFELVGYVVAGLGGSQIAATVVVWGLYLAAAGSALIWRRLKHDRGYDRLTVTCGILAAPLWLGAIAVTPPSRIADDSTRRIGDFVGDESLGSNIGQAISSGLVMVLLVVGISWLFRRTVVRDRRG